MKTSAKRWCCSCSAMISILALFSAGWRSSEHWHGNPRQYRRKRTRGTLTRSRVSQHGPESASGSSSETHRRASVCAIEFDVLFFSPLSIPRKKRAKQRIADVPPLSKDKLHEIDDPLDYLYKYCIIQWASISRSQLIDVLSFPRSPDRMANYERIFLSTIKKQQPKFEGQNPPEHTAKLINLKRSNTDGGQWTNVGGGKYKNDPQQYHALDSSDEDEDPE